MQNNSSHPRHFLSLNHLTPSEINNILIQAIELKNKRYKKFKIAKNKHLALIFEAASTRTRVSFETGIKQLGGHAIFLPSNQTQLGRGEAISDTAKVISRMVEIVVARIISHKRIEQFAQHSQVPVINALSDQFHPCQLLADMLTFRELRGSIKGAKVAWIGDGNNVCHSWMNAARLLNFKLSIAVPKEYQPEADLIKLNQNHIDIFSEGRAKEAIYQAAKDADLVVTDTWVSMGQEENKEELIKTFSDYKVTNSVMKLAKKDALFMHCLPAYRGLEVDESVIDGEQSVVWQESENRLHVQKALLLFLLSAKV